MFTGFPISDEWKNMQALFSATRWNHYRANWPIALNALRQLWEMGKVSELKSPFFEPIDKLGNQ